LGFWGGVLRGILGWRRGANGRFCRGIPGVSGWARVWRGDSAHGGQYRGGWAKKFLKNNQTFPFILVDENEPITVLSLSATLK